MTKRASEKLLTVFTVSHSVRVLKDFIDLLPGLGGLRHPMKIRLMRDGVMLLVAVLQTLIADALQVRGIQVSHPLKKTIMKGPA